MLDDQMEETNKNAERERRTGIHDRRTKKRVYDVIVSKKFLNENDNVLIIDDFLANGCAVNGLIKLIKDAGASIAGVGIAVEKGFQQGGDLIRKQGIHLESLAIVESMDASTGEIVFRS